jgi:putative ABC transport system permease protein
MLEQCWQDLRMAWRGLHRAPAFSIVAILTLAVGIAGATAMFAVVEGVLLRPLPLRDQDGVLVAWKAAPTAVSTRWPFHADDLRFVAGASRVLEAVAGVGYQSPSRVVAVENGVAGYVQLAPVTAAFFDVLGVRPRLGRDLAPSDDVAGAEPVALITYGLWQRRYGGSPDAIGRRLIINGKPFTVIAVMPADLDYPRGVEAWVPVTPFAASIVNPTFRDAVATELLMMARVRPGFTPDQAVSELRALAPQLDDRAAPGAPKELMPVAQSYEEAVVGDVRGGLLVLTGAVALVLLIAGANVANLLLMRGEQRRTDVAVRAALGASRVRLVRQLTAESVLLAGSAAAAGLLVTVAVLPAVASLAPEGLPRADSIAVDAAVIGFTILLAFITAALAGLSPALALSRTPLAIALRSGTRGATGTGTRRGRRVLVVVQVALAAIVMTAAGVLMRSAIRLERVGADVGADRLVLVALSLPPEYSGRERRLQFLTALTQRLESTSAIAAATPINVAPFSGTSWGVPVFTAEGQSRERATENPSLDLEAVHANYFATFQLPILRGRSFTAADTEDAPPVAVVSEEIAARTWPGGNAIGRRLKMGPPESGAPWMTIVGVAASTRYRELRAARPTLYVPAEQLIVAADTFVLRTPAPPAEVRAVVIRELQAIEANANVVRVAPFRELLDGPLARPRFNAVVSGTFAGAALLLAAVGLYAVMSAFVRLHQRDIGVRVAVGASAADVRRLVVGEAARLAGIGAGIGFALSAAGHRLVRGLSFEVTPLDPVTFATAAVGLLAAATIACYLPARRAARIDPAIMLRAD